MMKPEDLKKSIDSVQADEYLKTRLLAKIADAKKPKRKKRKAFKMAASAVLCCTVLAAGLGFGIPQRMIDEQTVQKPDMDTNGNLFILSVYAEENKEGTPVTDHTVFVPDYKIQKAYDKNGDLEGIKGHSENGFYISGNNIQSVKYICKTGAFHVFDVALRDYLIENNQYFDAVVPYSDEYERGSTNMRADNFFKHMENGDYDAYIDKSRIKSRDEYISADIIYNKNDKKTGIGLVAEANFEQWFRSNVKEYEFQNYNETAEKFASIIWDPNMDVFINAPETRFSEIPHDVITVEVTFKDGSVQTQQYELSFNDSGDLVVDIFTQ